MNDDTAAGIGFVEGYDRATFLRRGGTATLYSARRSADGEPVVVKVFDADQTGAAERQRHIQERLAGIGGVLPDLEHGVLADGRAYVVLRYIGGGSLSDHITRFGPMPPTDVAAFGASLAATLHEAHAAGVLHRDLKPSNVLLAEDGSPLLCDFGAATTVELATASETMALTVLYAAPEVLEGAPGDERSDQYSLGLTLQAAACGSHPFGGTGVAGIANLVNQICTVGSPDPSELGLPAGLAAVLRRATALDPADRYPDCQAFAEALGEVAAAPDVLPGGIAAAPVRSAASKTVTSKSVTSKTVTSSTDGASGQASGPGRRSLVWVGAVALVVAVGVVVGAFAWRDRGTGAPLRAEGSTTTTAAPSHGPRVTEGNGVLGPLFQTDEFTYHGQMTRECKRSDRWVAFSIHADQDDRKAGVSEPWAAIGGKDAGTFMAYLPCENGGRNIRYVLRAPGRWFVSVATVPQDQYDRMVGWMRENETSPAPDYTVDDEIRATLTDPANYLGWNIIDRSQ